MNFLSWLLFGLIIGILVHFVKPTSQFGGFIGTIVLGIIGAVVGGFLGDLIFGVNITGFNLTSFAVAVLGALGVLWAYQNYRKA